MSGTLDDMHRAGALTDDEFIAGLLLRHHHWTTLVKGDPLVPPVGCRFTPRLGKTAACLELHKAAARVGPHLWPILFAVFAEDVGVTEIERRHGLPRRSGKVAIKAALSVLASDPRTFASMDGGRMAKSRATPTPDMENVKP